MERSARWMISSLVAATLLLATSVPAFAGNPHGGGTDTPELPSVVLLAIPLVVAGVIWRVRHRH